MWKAEKIELIQKGDHNYPENIHDEVWKILEINEETITNSLIDTKVFKRFEYFQCCICSYCGCEDCNTGGFLMVRKQLNSLLFLPAFSDMEEFSEYESSNGEGDSECPPHKWFTDGILVVEGEPLKKLIELIPGLSLELIPEMTEQELENMNKWESLVKKQPKGFINRYYYEN